MLAYVEERSKDLKGLQLPIIYVIGDILGKKLEIIRIVPNEEPARLVMSMHGKNISTDSTQFYVCGFFIRVDFLQSLKLNTEFYNREKRLVLQEQSKGSFMAVMEARMTNSRACFLACSAVEGLLQGEGSRDEHVDEESGDRGGIPRQPAPPVIDVDCRRSLPRRPRPTGDTSRSVPLLSGDNCLAYAFLQHLQIRNLRSVQPLLDVGGSTNRDTEPIGIQIPFIESRRVASRGCVLETGVLAVAVVVVVVGLEVGGGGEAEAVVVAVVVGTSTGAEELLGEIAGGVVDDIMMVGAEDAVRESLLPERADSPEPLLEPIVVESLRPLREDSPEPRRVCEGSLGVIIVVDSRLDDQRRARSDRKSLIAEESRRDFECLNPESAEDSRRFLSAATVEESVVELRPQGRLLAMSANVSRRCKCVSLFREPFVLPPHSRKMSVSCASELLRRLDLWYLMMSLDDVGSKGQKNMDVFKLKDQYCSRRSHRSAARDYQIGQWQWSSEWYWSLPRVLLIHVIMVQQIKKLTWTFCKERDGRQVCRKVTNLTSGTISNCWKCYFIFLILYSLILNLVKVFKSKLRL
ncbi:hypothetical protein C0J52_22676 [Blattella germanica]|nr:hypothetical protein C0J52_22676 [Blattella germanica]